MNSLQKHLSYANVVATLALVLAMGGSAIAAQHYLITSTSQISPKVLKKLKAPGARGPAGPQGAAGQAGIATKGADGAKGADGLSALANLPSGQSESGVYGIGTPGGATGELLEEAVPFTVPLAEGLTFSHTLYTAVGTPIPHCTGPGHADPGYLCIYSTSAGFLGAPIIKSPEIVGRPTGAGRLGFFMQWTTTAANAYDIGTYTVTAP